MKNLYLILRKSSNKSSSNDNVTFTVLKKSAEERGVQVQAVYSEDFDFSTKQTLTESDALYRISTDVRSRTVEQTLINEQVISFHSTYMNCIRKNVFGSAFLHSKANLKIIPTIFAAPQNRDEMETYVQALGGFPIIVKATGMSHGQGIMKMTSFDQMESIFLPSDNKKEPVMLKKFIQHKEQARLIVVGDTVVAHHTNLASVDFRTNVGDDTQRKRILKEYNQEVKQMAIDAVAAQGAEFGGVDILIEEDTGIPYIAESNFPCFFPRTQELTGIDISGYMIDYLIQKSQKSV